VAGIKITQPGRAKKLFFDNTKYINTESMLKIIIGMKNRGKKP
jgi:hypothetical protein